jgi:hypothetical protein
MPYPASLGQRPLQVQEAYAALEQYVADYGRSALLLMMHAAVPETLRVDLLHLIRVNFLAQLESDASLEADVLFGPLTSSAQGNGYYRIDAQVRWHCLGLLQSLYRNEPRPRALRVAELLWRYVSAREPTATREADPQLAEYLAIQRWVALAYLEPKNAARAFALALHRASTDVEQTVLRLGGLASAIELPLAGEQELLTYAQGLDALVRGDEGRATELLGALGSKELRVSDVLLKSGATLLHERKLPTPTPPSTVPPALEGAVPKAPPRESVTTYVQLMPLPEPPLRVVGRDALIVKVAAAVLEADLTVLIGPHGIGKMTFTRAVAATLRGHFSAGARFVDNRATLPDLALAPNQFGRLGCVAARPGSARRCGGAAVHRDVCPQVQTAGVDRLREGRAADAREARAWCAARELRARRLRTRGTPNRLSARLSSERALLRRRATGRLCGAPAALAASSAPAPGGGLQ